MDLKSYIDGRSQSRTLPRNRALLATLILIIAAAALSLSTVTGAYLHSKGYLTNERISGLLDNVDPRNLASQIVGSEAESLPTVDLRIGFADLTQLEEKRQEAYDKGILQADDSDFVPVVLESNGVTFDGQVRLKGDWADHAVAGKPSFRIELDSGDAFDGMTRFSLHHPGTRNYLQEWSFFEHARSLDLIAPRYGFMDVTINGESSGIYAFEEHFTAAMLEAQHQRPAAILKWDEDGLWAWRAETKWTQPQIHWSFIKDFGPDNSVPLAFQPAKVARDPLLQQQVDSATALLLGWEQGLINTSDVFDVEKLATFGALADLWGARHGIFWHNRRFYFNPTTALLEPIVFDMEPAETESTFLSDDMLKINNDRLISAAYVAELGRLSQPLEVEKFLASRQDEIDRLTGILEAEFGTGFRAPERIITNRAEAIRTGLNPAVSLLAVRDRSSLPNSSIFLRSLGSVPIEVLGFTVDDGPIQPAIEALVDPESTGLVDAFDNEVILNQAVDGAGVCPGPTSCVRFELGIIPVDSNIQVASRIIGTDLWSWTSVAALTQPATEPVVPIPSTPHEVLAAHVFLQLDDSNLMFNTVAGTWEVSGDLFLPSGYGLTVTAGTTLRFDEDAVMRMSGPLRLLGTSQNKVSLEASRTSWAGIAVIRSPIGSRIEHAEIKNTTGVNRGGWQLSGGVTFFESDVDTKNSLFEESSAEDALNIIRSHFTLIDTSFTGAVSDGFDGDFVTGRVTGGVYADIGGDAIDVAGSEIDVIDTEFRRIGDKALSIGESSVVNVNTVLIEDVALGIVSKDKSEVHIQGAVISRATTAALAAYQKKAIYGPSFINAASVQINDSPSPVLVDRYSWITLDGNRNDVSDLDINALYDAGILGN
jgi:hypothetical protein